MPIDITLPLEVNRPRDYPTISNPVVTGNTITVTYDTYSSISFDATTGIQTGVVENDNPLRLRNKSDEVAVKQFKICFGHKDWGKSDWRYLQDDALYLFTDPKLAATRSKELNAESAAAGAPWRFMVKSDTIMSANHAWRDWMRSRFESGEYTAMPWANEEWYLPFANEHFCHPSLADPFKVAYVESPINGVDDRITVTNPGRYLERFFSDKLNAQEIAQWAAKADSEANLCFASTPEDIVRVYTESGISSCMSYKADNPCFPLGIHPTSIYGAGDLQLAYLERKGKIVGRALVWPEKKVIGRIYGDMERLKTRLIGEGYTYVEGKSDVFDGARLLRIEVAGEIVMPYLDWSMGASDLDDNFLVVKSVRPKYRGQTQNGTASGRSIQICGFNGCRTHIPEGQGFYNQSTGRQMCDSCGEQHLVRCVVSNGFAQLNNPSRPATQVLNRDGTVHTGPRGGYVDHNYAGDSSFYRRVNDAIYLARDCRLQSGSRSRYELIPA